MQNFKVQYWKLLESGPVLSKKLGRITNITTAIMTKKSRLGKCPICGHRTLFYMSDWRPREGLRCLVCKSSPRERALMMVIDEICPNYRELYIHESSPDGAVSDKLMSQCRHYSSSQFFTDVTLGTKKGKFHCEDLRNLTFADNSFDLMVTQDVFEHVINPDNAFREIARTLRSGGQHIFTIPWNPKISTRIRATDRGNGIEYLENPVYHGNPIDRVKGSLVATDWGKELAQTIYAASGLVTQIYRIKDRASGIAPEFMDVFVSSKD